ncbi:hypothetical protein RCL1_005221 [Eukaryota sp. TZLM3-RCL]
MSDYEEDLYQDVKSRYGAIPQVASGLVGTIRQSKRSAPVSLLNNWIKTVVISEAITRTNFDVLDLSGGAGGDLKKWFHAKARSYVLVDLVDEYVKQAVSRRRERIRSHSIHLDRMKNPPMTPSAFVVADVARQSLDKVLPPDCWFDVVSCQFAAHYFFASEQTAHQFFENASSRLRWGGSFVMTAPNSQYIVKRTRDELKNNPKGFEPLEEMVRLSGEELVPGPGFGSNIYGVLFPPETVLKKFGTMYWFYLADAFGCVREYLINEKEMERIARSHNLFLERREPFYQILDRHYSTGKGDKNRRKLQEMRVFDPHEPELSHDAWELAHFYAAFTFRKRKPFGTTTVQPQTPFASLEHLSMYRIVDNQLEKVPEEEIGQGQKPMALRHEFVYELQEWEQPLPVDDWKQGFSLEIPEFHYNY